MVTQQILVLFFQVRILVAQLKTALYEVRFFLFFSPAEFGGADSQIIKATLDYGTTFIIN